MHITTKIIILENIFIFIIPVVLWLTGFDNSFPYEWHKLLHITGAVIFLGNIIVTGLWMYFASQTNDQKIIHFAAKATNWMDVFFTGPGAILLLGNGLWLARSWGVPPIGFLNIGWILIALVLFLSSGLIWFYLIYLQEKFITSTGKNCTSLNEFSPLMKRWIIWGTIAILLPLVSMILMVLKPSI